MKLIFNPLSSEFQFIPNQAREILVADKNNYLHSKNVEEALEKISRDLKAINLKTSEVIYVSRGGGGGGSGDMVLADVQTVSGAKTFNDTKLLLRNVANTFNGSFVNTNTADRIYTLTDATGTIPLLETANVFTANQDISNAAPALTLTDTTASAKSLKILVDANVASFYELAGVAGDILNLDLVNKRVGIGTTSPGAILDVIAPATVSAPIFTRTVNAGAGLYAGVQIGLKGSTSSLPETGPSFLFFGDNSDAIKSYLGRLSAIWENSMAGAEEGAIAFSVRANSADTTASTEAIRINHLGHLGAGTVNATSRVTVAGKVDVFDPATLGSETLTNGQLTSGTSWSATGDFVLASNRVAYTHSTGAGTLTQALASLATPPVANKWYKLVYTVSSSTPAGAVATLTTSFASQSTRFDITNGTKTLYFKTAAVPSDFIISVTSTAGTFKLDTFSLKEVQAGDIMANGLFTGGGPSGIKVLHSGAVGIGENNPAGKVHIAGTADEQQLIVQANATQTANLIEYQDSSAAVKVKINSKCVFFPLQAPTASAPAYELGGMYFDTTLNKLRIGGATAWETITSA